MYWFFLLYIITYITKCFWPEIGEEFVEFLEKELNITDAEVEAEKDKDEGNSFRKHGTEKNGIGTKTEAAKQSSIEDDNDEIEAIAQLEKELYVWSKTHWFFIVC